MVQSKEIELIGGEDCYKAACRACFNMTENKFKRHKVPQISIFSNDERQFGQQNLIC